MLLAISILFDRFNYDESKMIKDIISDRILNKHLTIFLMEPKQLKALISYFSIVLLVCVTVYLVLAFVITYFLGKMNVRIIHTRVERLIPTINSCILFVILLNVIWRVPVEEICLDWCQVEIGIISLFEVIAIVHSMITDEGAVV